MEENLPAMVSIRDDNEVIRIDVPEFSGLENKSKTESNGSSYSYIHSLENDAQISTRVQELPKQQIIALDDSKAGMQGLNLGKINKIIAETSEGSKFYEHKRKMKQRLEQKAMEMRKQYDQLTTYAIEESTRKVDKIAAVVETKRDSTRVIVHIDMDCFFAAVEMRDNPSLKDKPMAVGSNSMLSTSNYHARKFGVRAAMPGFIAKKLCPNLIIIPLDFAKYSAASEVAATVYRQYDPTCYSCMDEASLDITEYINAQLTEDVDRELKIVETVQEIRDRVCAATNGLTCSAGISSVGFLSKICSDINKPNGQFRLQLFEEKEFLKGLKIRKVCGIGEATESLLHSLNIETCGDIWTHRGAVNLLFKPASADFLFKVSLGIGKNFFSFPSSSSDNAAETDDRKSISCERTFSETANLDFISELCHRLCTDLSEDLKSKKCTGKAVAVKIKTDTFDVKSRIRTMLEYTADAEVIYKTAWAIFQTLKIEQEDMILRLFGVRISTLKFNNSSAVSDHFFASSAGSSKQLSLFKEPSKTFECPICQKQCTTSFSLRKHVDECLDNSEKSTVSASCNSKIDEVIKSDSTCASQSDRNSTKREYPAETIVINESFPSISSKRLKVDDLSKVPKVGNNLGQESVPILEVKSKHIKTNVTKKSDSPIKMMPINFYFQNIMK